MTSYRKQASLNRKTQNVFFVPAGSTYTQVQGLIDVVDLVGDFSTTPGSLSASVITTSLLKATTDVLIGSDLDFQNTHTLKNCSSITDLEAKTVNISAPAGLTSVVGRLSVYEGGDDPTVPTLLPNGPILCGTIAGQ